MNARILSLLALVGSVASGCWGGDGYHHGQASSGGRSFSLPTCPRASTPVPNLTVDTDATLTTEAGRGAGVLVEYMNGGHWHIWTVCDTAISGAACNFDITAQVIGGKASNILAEELESSDVATSYCSDTAILAATTSTDFDGLWFDAPPGATVRVTAALGSAIYPDLFFWIGGGAVHDDAHANPVEFTPTTP